MKTFSEAPLQMFATAWQNRGLILALTKREVIGRYKGSALGLLWSFFNPLFMLIVYTFVFSQVFKSRWPGGSDSKIEFALLLLSGLMVFNLFSECLGRAPGLVLANPNYVKKVVFPLEILPLVSLGSALFHLLISIGVWLLFYLLFFGLPHLTLLLFPLVITPLLLLVLGFSWFLASLGVYLRDVGQVVGIIITALMFLSPLFFPITSLPQEYQGVIHFSPITVALEEARQVMYWGKSIDWQIWTVYLGISLFIAWLGFAWFQKTRRGFADVM
jgi:lipopolysaccharide transport system permease protein